MQVLARVGLDVMQTAGNPPVVHQAPAPETTDPSRLAVILIRHMQ